MKRQYNAQITAARIKEARTIAGLTQHEFAERIGKSRDAVAKWEAGKAAPYARNIRQISELIHCSFDWLIGEGKFKGGCNE